MGSTRPRPAPRGGGGDANHQSPSASAAAAATPPMLSGAVLATLLSSSLILAVLLHAAAGASLLPRVLPAALLSLSAAAFTAYLVPSMAPLFARAGRVGRDINKPLGGGSSAAVPESLGLVPATVYLVVLCLLHGADLAELDGDAGGEARLYTAAMASVAFMVLLGFADDVLDLKWRYNLAIPLIASMPLLVNYRGSTSVLVPSFARGVVSWVARVFFGGGAATGARLVDIGVAYYIYMALLSIFCTNAINIYAGINGLEAGQSAVIAGAVLLHNAANFNPPGSKDNLALLRLHHAFSVDLVLPFAAVTVGLLAHNWYPSAVFVGDTFCYFAGMTFAMASILGHYSETLLLFFIPQILNFLLSLPQLVGIVPCPRHRLPKFNPATGKLEAVRSHWNLVNFTLALTGPLTEHDLCVVLLVFQAVCCAFGMLLRAAVVQYVGGST